MKEFFLGLVVGLMHVEEKVAANLVTVPKY